MKFPKGFRMLVATSTVPNATPSQSGASGSAKTSNRTGIAVCQACARCRRESIQKPEHKAISCYRVRQLAGDALQAGGRLVHSAAGFAFSQVMNSPYIGSVVPGLKETLLGLAVLYNQQQSTVACASGQFQCNNGECIAPGWQCDGEDDCDDASDEQGCTQEECESPDFFSCDNKECIKPGLQCNGYDNCGDNSDEQGCTQDKCAELGRFICDNKECIDPVWQCDGENDCSDSSDEQRCTQDKCTELGRDFHCDNNQCIDPKGLCNGYDDCFDRSDERAVLCNSVTSPATSTITTSPVTSPVTSSSTSPVTYATNTDLEVPAEPSPYAWLALPSVLAAGAAAAYGVCTYKSYKTLRQGNPNAPATPLLLNALRHPLQFRQSHHQPEAAMELQTRSGSARSAESAVALQNV
ncbi:LDL receptor domain-containing protein [Endozoicomonas sp. SCSIO W0465]|uniref:LDL receptor domain-containing protein n=1 Tax=Endozoicomonas sp. SCSIO W0465 TaxID=2918516 RepID=UPI0020750E81|nr:LDL receptor domain-containing protein [Endozoicomonas sp. SCSIO W0465]USE37343.1 LDL receptor domain-containing protein [Endozoicomonas sp. SCSIO W0465]